MERIFLNGCSFSTDRKKTAGVLKFPGKIVADYFTVPLHTLASAGRGNRRIATTTQIWLAQNPNFLEGVYAIIQWSTPNRRDYTISKEINREGQTLGWKSWKIHDEKEFMKKKNQWDLETELTLHSLENILVLQYLFQSLKIPYVMYEGLDCCLTSTHEDVKSLLNQIDWQRWFRPKINQMDLCKKNSWVCSPSDPHPNTQGQEEWGEALLQWIIKDIEKQGI